MTQEILDLLVAEKTKLDRAIAALQTGESNVPDWVLPKPKIAPTAPKRKKISAAARRRMAEGQKRRYAAIRSAAETPAPKKQTNAAVIAEAIAPKEDAEFKSKMSIAMAKSWAKRKTAAKKNEEAKE